MERLDICHSGHLGQRFRFCTNLNPWRQSQTPSLGFHQSDVARTAGSNASFSDLYCHTMCIISQVVSLSAATGFGLTVAMPLLALHKGMVYI
jgi:hypothetical protein